MRLSSLLLAVLVVGTILAIARDEIGRLALIIFFSGLGISATGVASVMALFQTIGAFGMARTISAHIEAIAATIVVLIVGTAIMCGVLFTGCLLMKWALP